MKVFIPPNKKEKMKRKILSFVTFVFALSAATFAVSCANTDSNTTTDSNDINEHRHAYASIAETPATCVTNGVQAHFECVDCGKLFVKNGDGEYSEVVGNQLETALADHIYEKVTETESTCSKAGAPEHYECTVCGKAFIENSEGEKVETSFEDIAYDLKPHTFTRWDTSGDEYDVGECFCGAEMPEKKFLKKLSVQDLVVTEITDLEIVDDVYSYNESYKQGHISLDEIEADVTVNGVYCGDSRLGDDINSFSLDIFSDKKQHGEGQYLTVVVTDELGLTHNVIAPLLLVTREIATDTDLNVLLGGKGVGVQWKVNGGALSGSEPEVYGYYKVVGDIAYTAMDSGIVFKGTFDGGNNKISIGNDSGGAPMRGMFDELRGTVKNLVIDTKYNNELDDRYYFSAVLARYAYNATFENLTINYVSGKDSATMGDRIGFLFCQDVAGCSFKSVTIDAKGKKIGTVLSVLNVWGSNRGENDLTAMSFEDFKLINCTEVGSFTQTVANGEVKNIMPWEVAGVGGDMSDVKVCDGEVDPLAPVLLNVNIGKTYGSMKDYAVSVTKKVEGKEDVDITDEIEFKGNSIWYDPEFVIDAEYDRGKTVSFVILYDINGFKISYEIKLRVKSLS